MEIPPGHTRFGDRSYVLKLKKSIYGLKQSGRNWYTHITEVLKGIGFVTSEYCPCVFRLNNECLILLYVDDIAVFAKNDRIMNKFFQALNSHYEVTNLGPIQTLLGVEFESVKDTVHLHQKKYIKKLLEQFCVSSTDVVVSTPMEVGTVYSQNLDATDKPYRALLGSLLFLASRTRPDIMFSVIYFAQFSSHPIDEHWYGLLRILKYVANTLEYSIDLSTASSNDLTMYSDASWATALDTRRSFSGYIWSLGGVCLGWRTSIQRCVAKSTMESEYIALDLAVSEIVWISNVVNECEGFPFCDLKPLVLCDNQAAMAFVQNKMVNNRTKHIDVRYHAVCELLCDGKFIMRYIGTKLNIADLLTKPLLKSKLIGFVNTIFKESVVVKGGV